MKNWEDLSFVQKLIVGIAITAIAILAPEIAMLLQFGGIEVAFTFLLFTLKPLIVLLQAYYTQVKNVVNTAFIGLRHSASAKPSVFALQASFSLIAIASTGSAVFALSFFMPGLLFNGALI